ncbi:Anp1-domain-containing protein [Dipodascopsis uninucleata]
MIDHGPFPLSRSQRGFNISSPKFHPRSRGLFLRRTPTAQRCLILALPLAVILFFFFPTFKSYFISIPFQDDPLLPSVYHYDLSRAQGTGRGWEREERVLMCVPLRDASSHMNLFFSHLRNLTYPHSLIDISFLVSDTKDDTIAILERMMTEIQTDKDPYMHFGKIEIFERDFGQVVGQGFSDRHGFDAQGPRRKLMARARNWLLSTALRPEHSWVYWRDVDVEIAPASIIEDLMRHNKDVIVPNIWRPLPDWLGSQQPYDLNSWQESETALQLAQTLDEDAVIVEGYAEYSTWRPHLAYLRDPYGDPGEEMEIDGVGGVSILAKARVFRLGAHFPAFSFERHAETEGFGKMCKRMHFSVVGLPHYVIWHLYEPSADDLKHMAEMEEERLRKEREAREEEERKVKEEEDRKRREEEKKESQLVEHRLEEQRLGEETQLPSAKKGEIEDESKSSGRTIMKVDDEKLVKSDNGNLKKETQSDISKAPSIDEEVADEIIEKGGVRRTAAARAAARDSHNKKSEFSADSALPAVDIDNSEVEITPAAATRSGKKIVAKDTVEQELESEDTFTAKEEVEDAPLKTSNDKTTNKGSANKDVNDSSKKVSVEHLMTTESKKEPEMRDSNLR